MTGTLEHLDPATVLVGDNVRDTAVLEPQFIASIAEHGVLQPVTAVRTDAGVEVRDGQRRTLAAREAGLTSIPVYVLDTAQTNTKSTTAERIAQQIVANDHREALTDAQRAKGIHQMLFDGRGPGHVQLAISPTEVVHAPESGDVVRIAPMPGAYVARRPVPVSVSAEN